MDGVRLRVAQPMHGMRAAAFHAHDLLRVTPEVLSPGCGDRIGEGRCEAARAGRGEVEPIRRDLARKSPAWLADALRVAPYVVVRRDTVPAGTIPVGARGSLRAQRHAFVIRQSDVIACICPEALANRTPAPPRFALPAFAALARVRDELSRFGLPWGPTGSVGFELATGRPSVTPTSDLDLLIRCAAPLGRDAAVAIHRALNMAAEAAHVRVDAQIDTPRGGFALSEYASGKPRVLLRTNSGPLLDDDPWRPVPGPHGASPAG